MARITKLELTQTLAALGEELKALRTEVSALRADNARLAAENDALRAAPAAPADIDEAVARVHVAAPATKSVARNPGRYCKNLGVRPAWQPSAAMQAARELAMRTGCVVRVG